MKNLIHRNIPHDIDKCFSPCLSFCLSIHSQRLIWETFLDSKITKNAIERKTIIGYIDHMTFYVDSSLYYTCAKLNLICLFRSKSSFSIFRRISFLAEEFCCEKDTMRSLPILRILQVLRVLRIWWFHTILSTCFVWSISEDESVVKP